jgi:malate dehydrogenase (oxaloacetate-decarboxylating)(NADP+)
MDNSWVSDIKGVVYSGRKEEMDDNKVRYAKDTKARSLADILPGADIFLGLSAARVLKPEMLKQMGPKPLILALANPEPEILPDEAKAVRPDAIIATGRSDFPNQVNNVLCFPFIFRGALDVGATTITEQMKLAAVRAIADLAQAEQSDIVAIAYGEQEMTFGPEYLIPKPFDPRLIEKIAPAVALAAMQSGVATRPIQDFVAYRDQLSQFVYHSGLIMKPVFSAAKKNPTRVVFCEGEDERVLRSVQIVVDEGVAKPILIARPEVLIPRIEKYGLRIRPGKDFEIVNPNSDPRFRDYWQEYHALVQRKGISVEYAKREVTRRTTLIGALMVRRGDADAMLCGTIAQFSLHVEYIATVIGLRKGANQFAAMNMLILPNRTLFICDTYVNPDPSADQIAEITMMAADAVLRFGITPKIALLSHSNFGSSRNPSAQKMSKAREILEQRAPQLEVEGEMHGDAALDEEIRVKIFPNSRLKGEANLLIMPTLDAANITFNLIKTISGDGITVGPILLGAAKPVHILTPTATVRRLVNMAALASVDASFQRQTWNSGLNVV